MLTIVRHSNPIEGATDLLDQATLAKPRSEAGALKALSRLGVSVAALPAGVGRLLTVATADGYVSVYRLPARHGAYL